MVEDARTDIAATATANANAAWPSMHQAQIHWQTMSATLVATHVHLHHLMFVIVAVAAAVVPNMKDNIVPYQCVRKTDEQKQCVCHVL